MLLISFKETIRSSDRTAVTGHNHNADGAVSLSDNEQSDYNVNSCESSKNKCKEIPVRLNHFSCDQFVESDCAAADKLAKPRISSSPTTASSKQKCKRPRCLTLTPSTPTNKSCLASARDEQSTNEKYPLESLFSDSLLSQCDHQDSAAVHLKRGEFDGINNFDDNHDFSSTPVQRVAFKANTRERFNEVTGSGWHKSIAAPGPASPGHSHRGSYGVEVSIKQEIQDFAALKSETADSGFIVDGRESLKMKRALSGTFSPYGSPLYPDELYEVSAIVVIMMNFRTSKS